MTPRPRRRRVVLGVLYVLAGAGLIGGGICLFDGCYLSWVLALFAGITALVWAYRVRTGHTARRQPSKR